MFAICRDSVASTKAQPLTKATENDFQSTQIHGSNGGYRIAHAGAQRSCLSLIHI